MMIIWILDDEMLGGIDDYIFRGPIMRGATTIDETMKMKFVKCVVDVFVVKKPDDIEVIE